MVPIILLSQTTTKGGNEPSEWAIEALAWMFGVRLVAKMLLNDNFDYNMYNRMSKEKRKTPLNIAKIYNKTFILSLVNKKDNKNSVSGKMDDKSIELRYNSFMNQYMASKYFIQKMGIQNGSSPENEGGYVIGHSTVLPTEDPSCAPSGNPTYLPSNIPSNIPSNEPSTLPSSIPSNNLSTTFPSNTPSNKSYPSAIPSNIPSTMPTKIPSDFPSVHVIPSGVDDSDGSLNDDDYSDTLTLMIILISFVFCTVVIILIIFFIGLTKKKQLEIQEKRIELQIMNNKLEDLNNNNNNNNNNRNSKAQGIDVNKFGLVSPTHAHAYTDGSSLQNI